MLLMLLLHLVLLLPAAWPHTPPPQPRPHLLLVYVDDWGWGNAGWHRNSSENAAADAEVSTPHLDSLVREGVEFTRMPV